MVEAGRSAESRGVKDVDVAGSWEANEVHSAWLDCQPTRRTPDLREISILLHLPSSCISRLKLMVVDGRGLCVAQQLTVSEGNAQTW